MGSTLEHELLYSSRTCIRRRSKGVVSSLRRSLCFLSFSRSELSRSKD